MENKEAEGSVYNGEEEKRMEEFFSLIRRFDEARNRMKGEIMEEKESRTKIRRLDHEGGRPSWVPSFAWEDFASNHQIEFPKPPPIFPTAPAGPNLDKKLEDEKNQEVVEDDDGLDLNLTL